MIYFLFYVIKIGSLFFKGYTVDFLCYLKEFDDSKMTQFTRDIKIIKSGFKSPG